MNSFQFRMKYQSFLRDLTTNRCDARDASKSESVEADGDYCDLWYDLLLMICRLCLMKTQTAVRAESRC